MKGYSKEMFFRVYDDSSGCYYEIRPDADSIGCVEVRYVDERGTPDPHASVIVPPEMARMIAEAMVNVADDIAARASE